ncbi:MAG: (Fe-S)-binding protein [Deltaproteobacteria bacterium]|nr:(Fe-S)-binding protein [Deltaproteobacteria bacterium]
MEPKTKPQAAPASAEGDRPVNVAKVRAILESNHGARMRTWLSICSRCGLCASSCFFYLANDKDPKLSPAYKVKITLGEMYKKKGQVSREFLRECYEVIWGQCTMCRRCSQYCPFGIDIASQIAVARAVCCSQGVLPDGLARTTANIRETGNQMAVSTEDWLETCEWMAEENAEEVRGLTIPVDKEGADFMYTVNPREPMFYPQELGQAAQIFHVAGCDWTVPSTGWDCTNLAMFAGDRAVAAIPVKAMYDKAVELGVKRIVVTECGHAYRSARFEGPYFLGLPGGKTPVEVVHSVAFFLELLKSGRIKIDPAKMLTAPVTVQDPCNVSRNGGLWEEIRELSLLLCTDFRDMDPNRDHNHCCGGGGGFIPQGPEFKRRRMASGKVKADQIKATGATHIIVPCHNCYDQITDLNKEYELGLKLVTFKELICESMILPPEMQPVDEDEAEAEAEE